MREFAPRAIVASVLIAAACTGSAQATLTVTAKFTGVTPGETTTINYPSTSGSGTTSKSTTAGTFNFTGATGVITGSYTGFCIDVTQSITTTDPVTWTVADLSASPVTSKSGSAMGTLRANLIEELWYNNYSSIGKDETKAAAFQIAIWEIVNETKTTTSTDGDGTTTVKLDVTSGNFYVSSTESDITTQANSWLGLLDLSGDDKKTKLVALTSSTYQDFVCPAPTPAPPAAVLGLIGATSLLLVGWARRRRRRPAIS